MKPDEKYMSQVNIDNDDIKFVPPSFNTSLFRNENASYSNSNNTYTNKHTDNNMNKDNHYADTSNISNSVNNTSNLFPSETEQSQLYCYYNSFSDCNEKNTKSNQNVNMPTPSEVLRDFDLNLDETIDFQRGHQSNEVDKIFLRIEKRNPGIFATFSSYRIPYPIAMVIIKRIIKLSLLYSDQKGR